MKYCYIVILNYKNWEDTVDCIRSIENSRSKECKVVVVDNDSKNNSISNIIDCANDVFKKNSYQVILPHKRIKAETKYTFIQNNENKGFAAGNNVAIEFIIEQDDYEWVLFLNNDAILLPFSINYAIDELEKNTNNGICSFKVLDYYNQNEIQAPREIHWDKWTGLMKVDKRKKKYEHLYTGMAFLVKKECLKFLKGMNENYFLYYEENDWVERVRGYFTIVYSPRSVVLHKGGASVGQSMLSRFCIVRSKLIFAYKFYPSYLPTIYVTQLLINVYFLVFKRDFVYFWEITKLLLIFPIKREKYVGKYDFIRNR